ncbi:MAG: hypothetical protein R3D98_01865 [Candidatus Krumholzibacteriia bacterium]
MPQHLVFTLTAGRTGTAWLAALMSRNLPSVEAHHEILGYDRFGLDTPDVSHLTLFNSRGRCDEVRAFWQRKAARVGLSQAAWYVETSHVLMKAGLVEHLDLFTAIGPVYLIALHRDPAAVVASLTQRGDLANVGNQWLWYLDPEYPQNILDPAPFKPHGLVAVRVWYVLEIMARQAYYEALLAERTGVQVIRADLDELRTDAGARTLLDALGVAPAEIDLPPPRNATPADRRLGDRDRNTIAQFLAAVPGDAAELGRLFHAEGHRLGEPRRTP